MAVVKRLVCLANSRKLSGRCVAGKEQTERGWRWVRPVSDRPNEEVSQRERCYEDGTDPEVLDIIDVPLKEARPKSYQSENWLLDPEHYWVRDGRVTCEELAALPDDPATLWVNDSSTNNGLRDRVSVADAGQLSSSLYLLHLEKMSLTVSTSGAYFGNPRRRVQAMFGHRGVRYWLRVTDPEIERTYLAKKDGQYEIGECFITVSLGEPFEGYCYKLVAAVIIRGT